MVVVVPKAGLVGFRRSGCCVSGGWGRWLVKIGGGGGAVLVMIGGMNRAGGGMSTLLSLDEVSNCLWTGGTENGVYELKFWAYGDVLGGGTGPLPTLSGSPDTLSQND